MRAPRFRYVPYSSEELDKDNMPKPPRRGQRPSQGAPQAQLDFVYGLGSGTNDRARCNFALFIRLSVNSDKNRFPRSATGFETRASWD